MDETSTAIARKCLAAAYDGTMDFPSILRALGEAGFEGYDVDYRRNTATYFRSDGDSLQLTCPKTEGVVATQFQPKTIEQAVREAQRNGPGYSYVSFCKKVKDAGCAGYMVSLLGRRVVYFGRTAETHVEYFPS